MKQNKPAKLKLASFFSGIGGFDLGFQRQGFQIVLQCEIDSFCNELLQRHWPAVKRLTDIRKVTHEQISTADVWAAGFPCQDVSLARMGPRAGLKGRKSGLFYEFARLVGEGGPPIVVIENVSGLLSSHRGRDFEIVVRTLAELGYSVAWRVLNSKNFGVPQSRQRVYIVGCCRGWETAGKILFESQCGKGNTAASRSNGKKPLSPFKESLGDPVKGPIVQALAYCLYACSARHTGTDWSRTYVTYPEGKVRRLTPRECEAIQGFPEDWTLPNRKAADMDQIESLRYTCLGNAVTVPVAEWLANRIRSIVGKEKLAETMKHQLIERTPAVVL